YPDSPVGPFRVASQLIVCRSLTRARGYALQSVVDGSAAALAALREVWGFPARPGRIRLDVTEALITGEVADDSGRAIATVTMRDLHAADPEHIHYDPI